ncbi:MAG TPA: NUDIX domain-containing protein [Croceibacterium sp.]|nr:NUDIX domain-containing protein [Croceibacterium sp.]
MKRSAGVLLYRRNGPALEVLLVHPGGPYWMRKDRGAWQMPKGEIGPDEAPEAAARREVAEELGVALAGPLQPLGEVRQAGGKWVTAYAIEQDLDPAAIRSNEFEMEWPPRRGRLQRFPEISAAKWYPLEEACRVMLSSQLPLLDLLAKLASEIRPRSA